jgi:hydroxyacylglutathione hydrolase
MMRILLVLLLLLQGEATVPSTLGDELDTNPFLRPSDAGIRDAVKADADTPDWEVFGRVRKAKDNF